MATLILKRKFGRLTPIKIAFKDRWYKRHWLCVCDCGNKNVVVERTLLTGESRSCGCWRKEHPSRFRHGQVGTRAYYAWRNMINRCSWRKSKSFGDYGGRGISVCKRWMDFSFFFKDMGQPSTGMTLERINNNRGYFPSNCKWATIIEQANNRRSNDRIIFNGKNKTITQWSDILGIKYSTLRSRIRHSKWKISDAFSKEVQRGTN